jgi:hypothetical protein
MSLRGSLISRRSLQGMNQTNICSVMLCSRLSACLNSRTARQILMESDVDIMHLEATGALVFNFSQYITPTPL